MPGPSRFLPLLVVLALLVGCSSGGDGATSTTSPTGPPTAAAALSSPTRTPSATTTAPVTTPTPPEVLPRPLPSPTATPTPPPPPPTPAACAPVVVVGARGSGQPPGLGAEVAEVVEGLQATGTAVTAEAVDYAASPVADALLEPERFVVGVLTGARALRAQTIALQARCPDAGVVWAGYSQGALVVRAAIDGIPDPATAGVAAVILLADPSRAPLDPVNRGSAPPDVGGAQTDDPEAVVSPVPPAWAPLATSWCLAGDPFCDASTADMFAGVLVHTQGYREQDVTAQAAAEAATLLGLG